MANPESVFLGLLLFCVEYSLSTLPIRLNNGQTPNEGRVEVLHNGVWGTICDDGWDLRAGNVACHQLGYDYVKRVLGSASFGRGSDPIWLDDLDCHGLENSLSDCSHNGWGTHNCDHSEDAGVECKNLSAPSYSVRLVNGLSPNEGRVEIQFDGIWGTVCDDSWHITDGNVVCNQLGYERATSVTFRSSFGQGSGPIWLDEVACGGAENRLSDCQHNGWGIEDCVGHSEDAGVVCTGIRATTSPDSIEMSTALLTTENFTNVNPSTAMPTSSLSLSPLTANIPTSVPSSVSFSTPENSSTATSTQGDRSRGLTDSNSSSPSNIVEHTSSSEYAFIATPGVATSSYGIVIGGAAGGVIGILVLLVAIVGLLLWMNRRHKKNRSTVLEFTHRILHDKAVDADGYDYVGMLDSIESENKFTNPQDDSLSYTYMSGIKGPIYEEISKKNIYEEAVFNDEADVKYEMPSDNKDALYCKLDEVTQKICREDLSLGASLGSGQFGTVYRGVWRRGQEEVAVALKTLKEGASEEDRVKFLQEAAIMGQFKHTNIVTMYGVIKEGEMMFLVLELLEKGDLRSLLLKARSGDCVAMDSRTLLKYCRQVVSGMAYLSKLAFVHRNLTAKSILVTEDEICKIADFGMSRDLMYESFYLSHGGLIPVKWTAPEALFYKTYSIASDVWNFGVVLYEIWSVGHKPFETMNNNKVLSTISSGVRLAPPPGCPRKIYSIMMDCWHPEISGRPSFVDISGRLSLPDSELLVWCEEDIPTQAHTLGAQLHHGQHLYTDLQNRYVGRYSS